MDDFRDIVAAAFTILCSADFSCTSRCRALFRFGMSTPLLHLLSPGVIAIYSLCALFMIAVAIAPTWRNSLSLNDAAFGAQVAAFPTPASWGCRC